MDDQKHFRQFAKTVELTLRKYNHLDSTKLLERQRQQIKDLVSLESRFRNILKTSAKGRKIYVKFIDYIRNEKKNILAARPYFRERQKVFTDHISGALKNQTPSSLYKFKVNYNFINFAVHTGGFKKNHKLVKLFNKIKKLRTEMLEQNLPLAISQAKIFYNKTPKSHLTWMDLIQIHCSGLLVAIDKFVPPEKKVKMTESESLLAYRKFRAVAIGRMVSDRIEQYSETVLHFFPTEKRILYRANKELKNLPKGDINFEMLTELVNLGIDVKSQKTSPEKLARLLAAASCVSGDTTVEEDEGQPVSTINSQVSNDDLAEKYEEQNTLHSMRGCYSDLTLLEKKILRLKGVEIV